MCTRKFLVDAVCEHLPRDLSKIVGQMANEFDRELVPVSSLWNDQHKVLANSLHTVVVAWDLTKPFEKGRVFVWSARRNTNVEIVPKLRMFNRHSSSVLCGSVLCLAAGQELELVDLQTNESQIARLDFVVGRLEQLDWTQIWVISLDETRLTILDPFTVAPISQPPWSQFDYSFANAKSLGRFMVCSEGDFLQIISSSWDWCGRVFYVSPFEFANLKILSHAFFALVPPLSVRPDFFRVVAVYDNCETFHITIDKTDFDWCPDPDAPAVSLALVDGGTAIAVASGESFYVLDLSTDKKRGPGLRFPGLWARSLTTWPDDRNIVIVHGTELGTGDHLYIWDTAANTMTVAPETQCPHCDIPSWHVLPNATVIANGIDICDRLA